MTKPKNSSDTINIYCRIRPIEKSQRQAKIQIKKGFEESFITIHNPEHRQHDIADNSRTEYQFKFDGIFDEKATQEAVFETVGKQCCLNAIEGYNSTIFAYGQTGSGKTWTMMGGTEYVQGGITPRAIDFIFQEIEKRTDREWNIKISYMEIYNDCGYDLLHRKDDVRDLKDLPRVQVRENEDGEFQLTNIKAAVVQTYDDAYMLLSQGDQNRVLAETAMNKTSTRSHCIFTIYIESREPGSSLVRLSKLNLVDLAGSERIYKEGTGVKDLDKIIREAGFINISLLYLSNVIQAIIKEEPHIPYRNCMLTKLLRDSIGGNCKTAMIATVNPALKQIFETISTCRFAQSVACIKQNAVVNTGLDKDALIKDLQAQIAKLKQENALLRNKYEPTKEKKPLTDPEKALIREIVEQYVYTNGPLDELGGDFDRLMEAYSVMRRWILDLKKEVKNTKRRVREEVVDRPESSEPSRKVAKIEDIDYDEKKIDADQRIPEDVRQLIKRLAAGINLRDIELDIIVGAFNRQRMNCTETATQTIASVSEIPNLPSEQQIQSMQTLDAYVEHSKPQSILSRENVKKNIERKLPKEMKKHYTNEKIAELGEATGMMERAKAFETFRHTYRKGEIMEKEKEKLQKDFQKAKVLAADINALRDASNKLKDELCKYRQEKAMQSLRGEETTETDDQYEEELKTQLSEIRRNYFKKVDELKQLKREIQHIKNQIEANQQRLIRDFEHWYATAAENRAKAQRVREGISLNSSSPIVPPTTTISSSIVSTSMNGSVQKKLFEEPLKKSNNFGIPLTGDPTVNSYIQQFYKQLGKN